MQHPFFPYDWSPKYIFLRLFSLLLLPPLYLHTFRQVYWLVQYQLGRTSLPPPPIAVYVLLVGGVLFLSPLLDLLLSPSSWKTSKAVSGFLPRKQLKKAVAEGVFLPHPSLPLTHWQNWIQLDGSFLPISSILGVSSVGSTNELFQRPKSYLYLIDGSHWGISLAPAQIPDLEKELGLEDTQQVPQWIKSLEKKALKKRLQAALKKTSILELLKRPDPLEFRQEYQSWRKSQCSE